MWIQLCHFLPCELISGGLSFLICTTGSVALNPQSHLEDAFTRSWDTLSLLTRRRVIALLTLPAAAAAVLLWYPAGSCKVPSSQKSLHKLHSCDLQFFSYITACLLTETSGTGFSASQHNSAAPVAPCRCKMILAGQMNKLEDSVRGASGDTVPTPLCRRLKLSDERVGQPAGHSYATWPITELVSTIPSFTVLKPIFMSLWPQIP